MRTPHPYQSAGWAYYAALAALGTLGAAPDCSNSTMAWLT